MVASNNKLGTERAQSIH